MKAMTDVVCHSGPDGKNSMVSVEANSGCLAYWRPLAPARVPGAFASEELVGAFQSVINRHARATLAAVARRDETFLWTLDARGSEARQEEQLELHHE